MNYEDRFVAAFQQDWADALMKRYPRLFKKLKYVECQGGWENLIDSLSRTIDNELNYLPAGTSDHIYVVQIKNKFGGLRYYLNESTPYMDGAINLAEILSFSICEFCGGPTSNTLCNNHCQDK